MRSSGVTTLRGHVHCRRSARALPVPCGPWRRVVVVGSANVDLVWHGDRLPAPGETVTDGEFVTGARRQGREPGRGRGRARRRRCSSSAASATTSTARWSAPISRPAASIVARSRPIAARHGRGADHGRRRRRERDRGRARREPRARAGRGRRASSAPATSCCARARSRSRRSRPRSRAPRRAARPSIVNPAPARARVRRRAAHAERARVRAARRARHAARAHAGGRS